MKISRIVTALCATVLVVMTAACDGVDVSAPESGPQFSSSGTNPAPGQQKRAWSAVAVTLGRGVDEQLIHAPGGTLTIEANGTHTLTIPKAVVTGQPGVVFRMESLADLAGVELTATTLGSTVVNDFGSGGFGRPVMLCFDLGALREQLQGRTRVAIAHRAGAAVQVVAGSETNLTAARDSVCANVWHFSQYVMVSD